MKRVLEDPYSNIKNKHVCDPYTLHQKNNNFQNVSNNENVNINITTISNPQPKICKKTTHTFLLEKNNVVPRFGGVHSAFTHIKKN